MVPTRRLAAIMFTDMVGATAAAQTDEAQALRLRDEQEELVRPLFAAHHGREIKSMGDGFLAEFDSALRAVECAIGIQRRLQERNSRSRGSPIENRIGVHLGDVEERGSDIVGDAVNVASRIEPLAPPGGICISGEVYSQVRNKIPNSMEKLPHAGLKGVLVAIDIYGVVLPWARGASPPESPVPTGIAVLPFTNISPDPKDEYIADGLTEELITVLSQLRELRVISRTSVMHYKATPKSASQIGTELGVVSILEGSVRKAGSRLRVSAQLIDARSDRHLWAKSYDRELDDVFAVQVEIAKQVAEALAVELRPVEAAHLDARPVVRSDSYLAYLKGRTLMHQQDEASCKAAKEQFDLAIALDPGNGAAYSGLSDLVRLHGAPYLGMSRKEAQDAGRRLAEQALVLDPNLAEAHASTAFTLWSSGYDWPAAEKEFRRALSLNPSYSQAHHWYAEFLAWQLRTDEALEQWALAEGSDPLSPFNLSHYAIFLAWLGRYDEAIARIRKLGEQQPNGIEYLGDLALYHRVRSQPDLYLKDLERLAALESNPVRLLELRAEHYVFSGEKEKCRALLREASSSTAFVYAPFMLAWSYAALGDLDDAFHWLDEALEARSVVFHALRYDPLFEPLRKDRRYQVLLRKANLA
ncbi:MAG: hypothetical protein L3J97_00075 [Thermoplasmata archaeon]|nr:hypothetical protein [Thermoplasmata archaeon]